MSRPLSSGSTTPVCRAMNSSVNGNGVGLAPHSWKKGSSDFMGGTRTFIPFMSAGTRTGLLVVVRALDAALLQRRVHLVGKRGIEKFPVFLVVPEHERCRRRIEVLAFLHYRGGIVCRAREIQRRHLELLHGLAHRAELPCRKNPDRVLALGFLLDVFGQLLECPKRDGPRRTFATQ